MIESLILSLLRLFLFTLIIRFIIDWVQVLSRTWRPTGFLLVIAETVFSITDPPLNAIRRYIKPIRLGAVSLDLGFLVIFIGTQMLMGFVAALF